MKNRPEVKFPRTTTPEILKDPKVKRDLEDLTKMAKKIERNKKELEHYYAERKKLWLALLNAGVNTRNLARASKTSQANVSAAFVSKIPGNRRILD